MKKLSPAAARPQYLDGITKASRKTLQHASGQLMEGAEQRYLLALQQLRLLRGEQASAAAAAEAALAPERARLAAAAAKTQAQREALLRFVADAAAASERAAAAGRIKAAVSSSALQRFLAAEPAKGAEVRALRACHARLRRQLEAAERRLKAADQLSAEGLHLVDYEQLRIENASLAAKREARAAEVDKLRGKLAQAVQVGWLRAWGAGGWVAPRTSPAELQGGMPCGTPALGMRVLKHSCTRRLFHTVPAPALLPAAR